MGFTVDMDAGDSANSGGRGGFALGRAAGGAGRAGAEGGPARRHVTGRHVTVSHDAGSGDLGREEESLGAPGREDALRVRWRGPEGRESVTAEMQLLAALEVAGISAAPDVIGMEEDGYLRETAPSLARRRGRRAADGGAPATGERVAQARAREDLESLVAALHDRGWVLGAPRGRGLGMRADGGVLALDLSGLRREESLGARSADLHWIDSVLEDEERTLRRRVHELSPGGAERLDVPGILDAPYEAEPLAVRAPQGVSDLVSTAEAVTDASTDASADAVRDAAERPFAALPAPRLRRARAERRSADDDAEAAPQPRRGPGTTLTRVLTERRHRRTALLSAAVVLVLGLAAGVTYALTTERDLPSPTAAVEAPGSDGGAGSETPAPTIEDPWTLAAELAGSRHAYLTGASDVPVAAEGGAAQETDERIRAAYEGYEVLGSGPVVHEAELLQAPDAEGRAVLRVLASNEPGQVIGSAGTVQESAGGSATGVDLVIVWDGSRWRILETRAV